MTETSGIILAGGGSRRMGTDKAQLVINGTPLIAGLTDLMASFFNELIIVTASGREYRLPGTREVSDIFPDSGPLGGIQAGLSVSGAPCAFVTACDMPFFSPELARILLDQPEKYDAVVPLDRNRPQPLYAVYNRRILPNLEEYISNGGRKVREFLDRLSVRYLSDSTVRRVADPGRVFLNVNTPEEYRKLV